MTHDERIAALEARIADLEKKIECMAIPHDRVPHPDLTPYPQGFRHASAASPLLQWTSPARITGAAPAPSAWIQGVVK